MSDSHVTYGSAKSDAATAFAKYAVWRMPGSVRAIQKSEPRDQNTHLDSWKLSPHSKEWELQEAFGLAGAG
jgi:hypothetical protein